MIILFLIYLVTLFLFPEESIRYAGIALQTWLFRLIPTLFPFMVLTSVAIESGMIHTLCKPFHKLIHRRLMLSEPAIFCILLGLLAGFPMGAKTVSECYRKGEMTKQEAEYLLSFCNVIGPMYLFGYVLPMTQFSHTIIAGIGLYGISLLYGIVYRLSCCKNLFQTHPDVRQYKKTIDRSTILENAVADNARIILLLGGNIIFFSVWSVIPTMINTSIGMILSPLIEISSGLERLANSYPIYSLLAITFGGICCTLQTKVCIQDTDLSIKKYILHKVNLVILTILYYLILFTHV